MSDTTPCRVAVIGSGIAGAATAWLLAREPQRYEVTLFEADTRPGGHTNSVDVTLDGHDYPVDTGFLVYNHRTYPNFRALLELLGVASDATEMSFSVSLQQPDLEWAGSDLTTLLAQPRNLIRPPFWQMLRDIVRFNRAATAAVQQQHYTHLTLGEYLQQYRYSRSFSDWYLLPMAGAIWSCPPATMLHYPFSTFARFCHNHGLLQIINRPPWYTIHGSSRHYLDRLLATVSDLRLGTPISAVRRQPQGGVILHYGEHGDQSETFDRVVVACHSDQALALLGDHASERERQLLAAIGYQPNRALLHTDRRLLPRRQRVWSAWNYLAGTDADGERAVSVSYLLNRLQRLPFTTPLLVSLNPLQEPDPTQIIAQFDYAHPLFDQAAVSAQQQLGEIQGRGGLWYAGAWQGYGFHEDGLKSALRIATAFGIQVPWQVQL